MGPCALNNRDISEKGCRVSFELGNFDVSLNPTRSTTSTMETLPDELLLRIMELACDETQIDEPLAHSQVWGLHNGFTQSRDLEWVLEKSSNAREAFATGSDTTNTPYVARIADTPEIHVNRLRSSMRTRG